MSSTELVLPRKILIIEDDATVRLLMTHVFRNLCDVLQATDGESALQIFRHERPDFVLTDLMLPGIDGVEVLNRARRTFYGACVPFMVLTASQDSEALHRCFSAGADDFMVKPVRVPELRLRVSSIYLRQQTVRDVNPLTKLPGNLVLKKEIEQRLAEGAMFTVLYFDLDHFKAFNDQRGFDAGDDAILLVASSLNTASDEHRFKDVFLGHVGGDDFVALVPDDLAEDFTMRLFEVFDEGKQQFYTPEELAEGLVDIVNRQGQPEKVPLLSVSVAGVTTSRPGLRDYRQVAHLAAELKHAAKKISGNSLVIDRRKDSMT
ncbi:MAG: GGDEF domain-containing response regulator [Myxococcales bacterium]|nr:GGDEF domain-containing response regulator [Myxococcales bacterium]